MNIRLAFRALRRSPWYATTAIATVGLAIALVVAGSLAMASYVVLRGEDAGFDPDGLAVLEVLTPGALTAEEAQARQAQVLARARQAPGVRSAATLGVPLLEKMFGGSQFTAPTGATALSLMNDVPVSASFFEAAGIRLLEGRLLTEQDIESGRPVAVVSDFTAREYWPQNRAVGQTLSARDRAVTVVGGGTRSSEW